MPQCPKCGTSLKDDYGMVACPSCGTFLFIDMEGNAFMGSAEPPPTQASSRQATKSAAPEPQPAEQPVIQDEPGGFAPFENFNGFAPANDASDNSPFPSTDASASEPAGPEAVAEAVAPMGFAEPFASPFESVGENAIEPAEQLPAEPEPQPVSAGNEDGFDMDRFMGGGQQESSPPDFGPANDPLGIASYANSEISQAKDGLLVFKVLISGIDSKELRESIREAVEDSRFGWNPAELMSRITKGTLTIENLSPVKAVILVNRIKRLPLKIRWEQYAITQMEGL